MNHVNQENVLSDKTVLIVDDVHVDASLAKTRLQIIWIHPDNIHIAENGQDAIIMATQQLFDLIMMDIQLPDLDGIAAIKQIRAHYKEHSPKIIGYTAYDKKDVPSIETMDGVIFKPCTAAAFKNEIIKNLQAENSEPLDVR